MRTRTYSCWFPDMSYIPKHHYFCDKRKQNYSASFKPFEMICLVNERRLTLTILLRKLRNLSLKVDDFLIRGLLVEGEVIMGVIGRTRAGVFVSVTEGSGIIYQQTLKKSSLIILLNGLSLIWEDERENDSFASLRRSAKSSASRANFFAFISSSTTSSLAYFPREERKDQHTLAK